MKIAVVGAGPAGASAGYHLARAGHKVALLDRCVFPRPKTCGDWVTRGALAELARMELPLSRLRTQSERYAEVRSSVLGAPNGKTSRVRLEAHAPGCCIPREVFDTQIVRRAVEAGCQLETVRVRAPAELRAEHDLVIDARGVYAGEANTVAVRAYWSVPASAADELTRSAVQLFTVDWFRMGYGWIFPVDVGEDRVELNLGIGIWREEHDAQGVKIREHFERFVERNPVARRLARVATERGRTRGHHLALATGRREVSDDGVLRVGDAANLTDPITGEGIANAVLSGRLAAEAVGEGRAEREARRRWQQRYERRMLPELRAALRLRNLLLGRRRKNLAMWVLRRSSRLAARFHGSLEGVVSYRDVLG